MRETAAGARWEEGGERIPVVAKRQAFRGLRSSGVRRASVPEMRAAWVRNLPPKNPCLPRGGCLTPVPRNILPVRREVEVLDLSLSGKTSRPVGEGPSCPIL